MDIRAAISFGSIRGITVHLLRLLPLQCLLLFLLYLSHLTIYIVLVVNFVLELLLSPHLLTHYELYIVVLHPVSILADHRGLLLFGATTSVLPGCSLFPRITSTHIVRIIIIISHFE